MLLSTTIGILIPFVGTSLGAAMVFVLKDKMSEKLQKGLTGFAAGVMVAASFWSLLVPALDLLHLESYPFFLPQSAFW